MKSIGEELKYQRENNGFSQSEIAKETGFSQAAISMWERGELAPSIYACIKLANIYGITLDELVGRDVEKTDKNI